jgi:predicted nicotinamide N-methyase
MHQDSKDGIFGEKPDIGVQIKGRTFRFQRPADLESLWEQMDAQDGNLEERIPYWVELWPASIVLAGWLLDQEKVICGARCLDLGCGLGLCTRVGAICGADVVGIDYQPSALHFARKSCPPPHPLAWLGMDWRHPCFKARSFPYIFGADILYETRFFTPLLDLWAELLAPGGTIWISAPDRQVTRPFWTEHLPRAGWTARCVLQEEVSFQSYQGMQISLWEISSRSRSRSRPG